MYPAINKRLFSSVVHLSADGIAAAKSASEIARTAAIPSNLYLEPAKWKGLPSEKIFHLYRERMVKLGSEYKFCNEELEALMSTSEETGILKRDIKKIYYNGEKGAVDILGGSLKDNYSPTPFMFDELPSQAQQLVGQHREQRFYNRLAAYELPMLTQYRQPYKRLSSMTHPLKYRFTTYLGEAHPNSRKVVLQLKTSALGLNKKELHKFRLLSKSRYDHLTDVFKMSSERYAEAAQNAHYLSDVFQKLLKESKDVKDDFSDIPLDTRHTIAKNLRKKRHNYVFPDEWKRPEDAPQDKFNFVEELGKNL